MKKKKRQFILNISKVAIILLIATFIFHVYGSTDRNYDAALGDVSAAVLAEGVPEGCAQASELEFRKEFGLNAGDFPEGVVYYKPVSNMDVTEIIIAKTGSDEQEESLVDSINEHLDKEKSVFEGYAPEQYALLKNAVVTQRGNYIFYMSGEDADKYFSLFIDALK